MLNFVRPVVSVALILAFTACSDPAAPTTVSEAQSLWRSKNIPDYSYVEDVGCFCVPTGPLKVEVVGGHVTRVTVIATGAELPTTSGRTIDELFDQILAEATPPTVEFNRALGYPTKIERCCLADDSGSVITISALTPSA